MIIQEIKESGCEFRVIKLKGTGKNALDFYIAAECGIISERGENEIAMIKDFRPLLISLERIRMRIGFKLSKQEI